MEDTKLVKALEGFDHSLINIPGTNTKVYKDECVLSHHTANFLCFSQVYLDRYVKMFGTPYFLNIKEVLKFTEKDDLPEEEKSKVKFGDTEVEIPSESDEPFETLRSLVIIKDGTTIIPLPNVNLPTKLQMCVDSLIAKDSEKKRMQIVQVAEKLDKSKYCENLIQLPMTEKVPQSGWKCGECDKTDNLWLNLSDGYIGCGRRQYDGSGGNNHGYIHYEKTNYPLVVKLGTITAKGADVFSYAEASMVLDTKLDEHLKWFGIDMERMKKTDKTMDELALESSLKLEMSSVLETGKILKPLMGPGLTGMKNIGSTCYLAALMQVLFSIPEMAERFTDLKMERFFAMGELVDPGESLELQMTKLCTGLNSGVYSVPSKTREIVIAREKRKQLEKSGEGEDVEMKDKEEDVEMKDKGEEEEEEKKEFVGQDGIPPTIFKNLIGRGHPEFSTFRQQDPSELFEHLIQLVDREESLDKMKSFSNLFRFVLEEKTQCQSTQQYKIMDKEETVLSLGVDTNQSINLKEYKAYEKVRQEEERLEEIERQAKLLRQAENKKRKEQGLEPLKEEKEMEPGKKVEKAPVVRPKIVMENIVRSLVYPSFISDYYSSAAKKKTQGIRTYSFKTLPEYLVVKIQKYYFTDAWVPKKLDVCVLHPQKLDLSQFKSEGRKEGEVLMEDSQVMDPKKKDVPLPPPKPTFDIGVVTQVVSMGMGFSQNACKRACIATNNQGVEQAVNWILQNLGNANLNDPLEEEPKEPALPPVPEDFVVQMSNMGIPRDHAEYCLRKTSNLVPRAIDYYFSHQVEVATECSKKPEPKKMMEEEKKKKKKKIKKGPRFFDGGGKYDLFAFISHLGSNTGSGHYVCHIKKSDDQWVLFNDSKVLESQEPPFDRGYLYFYRREKRE